MAMRHLDYEIHVSENCEKAYLVTVVPYTGELYHPIHYLTVVNIALDPDVAWRHFDMGRALAGTPPHCAYVYSCKDGEFVGQARAAIAKATGSGA